MTLLVTSKANNGIGKTRHIHDNGPFALMWKRRDTKLSIECMGNGKDSDARWQEVDTTNHTEDATETMNKAIASLRFLTIES